MTHCFHGTLVAVVKWELRGRGVLWVSLGCGGSRGGGGHVTAFTRMSRSDETRHQERCRMLLRGDVGQP